MRVKLDEVADLAGVGTATVDRVLNERGGVSPATAKKVIEAARQLGWARDLPSPYRKGLRFEVILGRQEVPLFASLSNSFERLMPIVGRGVLLQRNFVDHTKPALVAKAIQRTKSDALILYVQESDAVLEAIASVTAAGIPVVTMVSDLPTSSRLAYVGIDHYRAGRAAAYLMSRMAPEAGAYLALCQSLSYRSQAERISGFREGLAEYNPHEIGFEIVEGGDDVSIATHSLRSACASYSGRIGIYNAGAPNPNIEAALANSDQSKVTLIGHDLGGETEGLLRNGVMSVAIDESYSLQARRALEILLQRFGLTEARPEAGALDFQIKVRDCLS